MAKKVLVVDDEKLIVKGIRFSLEQDGMEVTCAYDGEEALLCAKEQKFDMILLDIMLPKLSGTEVCQQIREFSDVPIVMLTAKNDDMDKIMGLEYGADDYMTKPFSPKVLLAKVNALLRRTSSSVADMLTAGKISIVPASHKVFLDGQEITLTHKEYELLFLFVTNPGQIFSREQLLNRIWGYDFEGNTRTVDTHIKTLRQKLGEEGKYIVTLIRSGYKFEVTV